MKPKETPPVKKETIPLKVEEAILVPEEKTFEVQPTSFDFNFGSAPEAEVEKTPQ